MTEFITRVCHAEESYEVIIKTDSADHYEATQAFARRLIDHVKPMTNADRIRAMTDEELAEFIHKTRTNLAMCAMLRVEPMNMGLEWLQQPAEGDA